MQTAQDQTYEQERDQKKKKRNARRDLLVLLKRLRKLCDSFQSTEDWYQFLQNNLVPLIEEHQGALGAATTQRLRDAAQVTRSTRAGVQQACKTLQWEIERVVPGLPGTPASLVAIQVAAGLLIAAALFIGAAVATLDFMAAQVDVRNIGCGTIAVPGQFNSIPGISFPREIPPDGAPYAVRMIPMSIELDTREANRLIMRITSFSSSWDMGDLESILLDDQQELLGQVTPLRLEPRSQHTLTLTCR